MIAKITIGSGKHIYTMMFGNSYKNWTEQFSEYCWLFKPINIIDVQTSKEKWKSWGGLKWCNEDEFQHELNREGCQSSEPDNANPRIYSNMRFVPNPIAKNIAKKISVKYTNKN